MASSAYVTDTRSRRSSTLGGSPAKLWAKSSAYAHGRVVPASRRGRSVNASDFSGNTTAAGTIKDHQSSSPSRRTTAHAAFASSNAYPSSSAASRVAACNARAASAPHTSRTSVPGT